MTFYQAYTFITLVIAFFIGIYASSEWDEGFVGPFIIFGALFQLLYWIVVGARHIYYL